MEVLLELQATSTSSSSGSTSSSTITMSISTHACLCWSPIDVLDVLVWLVKPLVLGNSKAKDVRVLMYI